MPGKAAAERYRAKLKEVRERALQAWRTKDHTNPYPKETHHHVLFTRALYTRSLHAL